MGPVSLVYECSFPGRGRGRAMGLFLSNCCWSLVEREREERGEVYSCVDDLGDVCLRRLGEVGYGLTFPDVVPPR